MKNPKLMLDLANEKNELLKLKALYARGDSLADVLEVSGTTERVNRFSKQLRGCGDTSRNRRQMLSICRQFDVEMLDAYFLQECRKHSECPLYVTPGRFFTKPPLTGMVVFRNEAIHIHYMRSSPFSEKPRTSPNTETGITIIGADTLVLFAQTTGTRYRCFNTHAIDGAPPKLGEPVPRLAQAGDCLFLEGGKRGMHLLPDCGHLAMIVCISNIPRMPVTQHFSLNTGMLVGHTAANVEDSRVQVLSTVLANIPGDQNTQALEALTRHPTSFVRWGALRDLHSLSASGAHRRIVEMQEHDPDEEIRALATQYLNGA